MFQVLTHILISLRTNEYRKIYLETLQTRCIADNFFESELHQSKHSKNPLTEEESNAAITPLLTDIFGAAQDTFTAAVQWFIVYLVKFPEEQKKVC